MFRRGRFNFLVLMLTLVLNEHKLGRSFGLVVILDFIPSHKSILVSSYDSSLALTEELRLGVHS